MSMVKISDYVYTGLLLATHMSMAIGVSAMGPAFVDLTYILNTSIQRVSLVPSVISFGNILGTLVGILYKYCNRQLIIIALLTLMSVSSAAIPFATGIWQLYGCALVFGACTGAWVAAYNVWLIEIWQHKAGHVLFVSQLMYGMGAIFGPLIDSPYLTGENSVNGNSTDGVSHIANYTTTTPAVSIGERRSKLQVPFIIAGSLQVMFPILLLLMFVVRRYTKNEIKHETIREQSEDNSNFVPKVITITLLAVCLSSINTLEMVYFNFGSTYFQYIPLQLCANTAARLVSVMSGAYTVGQVVNFIVAFIFRTEYIISTHFALSLIVFLCLKFFNNFADLLWFISAGIGLSVSVLFPSVLAFFGKYLEITDRIATLIWITSGVVTLLPPLFLGYFIKSNPQVFIIIELTFLVIAFVSFTSFLFLKNKLVHS